MCINSVSLSIVNLDITTVEQWDGSAGQVTMLSSDIL